MTDHQNRYSPPHAEVRDLIETKKLGYGTMAALIALGISWIWLVLFSSTVWELTKTGATSVLFMLGTYLGLVLVPSGVILLLRRSRTSRTVLGAATVALLLAAAKSPLMPVVLCGACASLVTYFAFRAFRQVNR